MPWITTKKIIKKIPVGSGTVPSQDTGWVKISDCTFERIRVTGVVHTETCNEDLGKPPEPDNCC